MLHSFVALARVVAGAGGVVRRTTGALVVWWTAGVAGGVVCGRVAGGLVGGVVVGACIVTAAVASASASTSAAAVASVVVGAALGDVVPTVGVSAGVPGAADPHPTRTSAATPATNTPAIRLRLQLRL